jgi:hypothetical protein
LRILFRICRAKCGAEAPMSWRTSSTVGSRSMRSLRSYSLKVANPIGAGPAIR